MDSVSWWLTVFVVVAAAVIDIRSRRIPNWLSLPYLVAGVVVSAYWGGIAGLGSSIAGIGLATVVVGILWYLRGMGMGDLKLLAAVGAWVGSPDAVGSDFVVGIAAGLHA